MTKQSISSLRTELRDLYDDYCAALDEGRLDDWSGYFTDDALYTVMSRESFVNGLSHATMYCEGLAMIRDRTNAIRETSVFEPRTIRHFVSGVRVLKDGDLIEARANFLLSEALYNSEPQILMVGEYLDVLRREDGVLKIKKRQAVYDNFRIRTALVMPV